MRNSTSYGPPAIELLVLLLICAFCGCSSHRRRIIRATVTPRARLLDAAASLPVMRTSTLAAAAAALCLLAPAAANDPSGGWLTYAKYTAPKPTDVITKLSAKMAVPAIPMSKGGSPAFWFGTQTAKGDGALVQPIMAKWCVAQESRSTGCELEGIYYASTTGDHRLPVLRPGPGCGPRHCRLGDSFYMFQEIFDWTDGHDVQSKPMKVVPGDIITAS